MYKHVSGTLHILLLIIFLGTCASSFYFFKGEPSAIPARAFRADPTLSVLPASVPESEPGWTLLRPGLEKREFPIYNGRNQRVESVHIWRLDQRYFRLDVAYDSAPKPLETWQLQTNAVMVVNGGYYSVENERYFPNGLTIVNGQVSGRSFGSGGMLAIHDSGAEVRWLLQKPYNASESLRAGLQSFPILVEPGGGLGFGPERENNVSARRTAIGQDRHGRILFIVAPEGHFTLHQFSRWLTESELNLDIAVNLDGGGSTGVLLAEPRDIVPPTRPLPFVILVHAR